MSRTADVLSSDDGRHCPGNGQLAVNDVFIWWMDRQQVTIGDYKFQDFLTE